MAAVSSSSGIVTSGSPPAGQVVHLFTPMCRSSHFRSRSAAPSMRSICGRSWSSTACAMLARLHLSDCSRAVTSALFAIGLLPRPPLLLLLALAEQPIGLPLDFFLVVDAVVLLDEADHQLAFRGQGVAPHVAERGHRGA